MGDFRSERGQVESSQVNADRLSRRDFRGHAKPCAAATAPSRAPKALFGANYRPLLLELNESFILEPHVN